MFVIIRAEYDGRPASAIPSFFRGRKYNGRLALRRGESRVTSLEARVRRLQLSERGRAMLNAGPWSCPFAPHEGQKAWKSGRSQNEGIPEAEDTPKRQTSTATPAEPGDLLRILGIL